MNDVVITKLDELIAATKAAAIPVDVRWLDADGIGVLLGQTGKYVRQYVACLPGFPEPMRIGHPRWKASEVMAWADAQRDNKGKTGRKRLVA